MEAAKQIGKLVGERAKAAGIETVVLDRGGFKYHGRVAGVADAVARSRTQGLEPRVEMRTNQETWPTANSKSE